MMTVSRPPRHSALVARAVTGDLQTALVCSGAACAGALAVRGLTACCRGHLWTLSGLFSQPSCSVSRRPGPCPQPVSVPWGLSVGPYWVSLSLLSLCSVLSAGRPVLMSLSSRPPNPAAAGQGFLVEASLSLPVWFSGGGLVSWWVPPGQDWVFLPLCGPQTRDTDTCVG